VIVRLGATAFGWGDVVTPYYDLSSREGVALFQPYDIGGEEMGRLGPALVAAGWVGERVWYLDLGAGTRREVRPQPTPGPRREKRRRR
jgi:hypothetical protein